VALQEQMNERRERELGHDDVAAQLRPITSR
jgi:hypothetical protein